MRGDVLEETPVDEDSPRVPSELAVKRALEALRKSGQEGGDAAVDRVLEGMVDVEGLAVNDVDPVNVEFETSVKVTLSIMKNATSLLPEGWIRFVEEELDLSTDDLFHLVLEDRDKESGVIFRRNEAVSRDRDHGRTERNDVIFEAAWDGKAGAQASTDEGLEQVETLLFPLIESHLFFLIFLIVLKLF